MASDWQASVVLGWHLHQPGYNLPEDGPFVLPWCYLHGIGGYCDLIHRLEEDQHARVVINFSPVLLEQLLAYSRRLQAVLTGSAERVGDRLLDALYAGTLPDPATTDAAELLAFCAQQIPDWFTRALPSAATGVALARPFLEDPAGRPYLPPSLLADLLVWLHLGWCGESLHRGSDVVRSLMVQGRHFDLRQRRALFRLIADVLDGLLPRYRRLAERGQIELSLNPWGHPILPLLLDLDSARESIPDITLPEAAYPDGKARVVWHLNAALDTFRTVFDTRPSGVWPSEAAISQPVLGCLAEAGFAWFASSARVLPHEGAPDLVTTHGAFRHADGELRGFFRDDGLSDLIGFTYQGWETEPAVAHFIEQLEAIGQGHQGPAPCVITVFLDGENPWPSYPDRGWHFTRMLYRALAAHPRLQLSLFRELVSVPVVGAIPDFRAGSWVGGRLDTWIGHPDKNRAWMLLTEAAGQVRPLLEAGQFPPDKARAIEKQLAVCEGSDWFWWMGEGHDAVAVTPFERLFRQQLQALYRMAELAPPSHLFQAVSLGSRSGTGVHTMLGAGE
ncbi:glycoside hydrolase [Marinobacter sp. NFXS9]|uniref:glycoside hydrolase n=1 Tax=Marinobacter sp. NFXS9 TaxID=2818433 RepID=UPI0032DF15A9